MKEKAEFVFELLELCYLDGLVKVCPSEVNSIGLETRPV